MSKLIKENPSFLNKTKNEKVVGEMRIRRTGSNNPMFVKPILEENKKLISKLFSKSLFFLYNTNTFKLLAKFNRHKYLTNKLKMSGKTFIKYKD